METLFIITIIILQIWFFYLTSGKIKVLKGIFKSTSPYKIEQVTLLRSDIEGVAPAIILRNLGMYQKRVEAEEEAQAVTLGLLVTFNQNSCGKDLVQAINTYLLRNNGAVTDFNLIKDITERYSDAIEDEINTTISIPLYLGLLGTLIGIVFGLSHISGLSFEHNVSSANALLDQAIPALLGGVKVAMVASFTGLLLTVLHSGLYFRKAKAANGRARNEFFTFIQIELLPLLNDNLNATLYSLQANLLSFNHDFGKNIQRLDGLMNKNYDALMAQEQFMDTLSKIDIMEFASANVKVLNGLQKTVRSFEDFTSYAAAVNIAIRNTEAIINQLNGFMDRTDNLHSITERLLRVFDQNQALMEFLQSHFSALDNSKQIVVSAVTDVSDYLGKAIDELKYFTEEKIAAVRTLALNESDLMKDTYPEKWSNLDELKKINQIIRMLADGNGPTHREIRTIADSLGDVKEAVAQMESNIVANLKVPSLKKIFKGLFSKAGAYEKA